MDDGTLEALQQNGYDVVNGESCRIGGSGMPKPLANCHAWIAEEIVRDDGQTQTRYVVIEGRMADGTPLQRVMVPARELAGLRWIAEQWGLEPLIWNRSGFATALQLTATRRPCRRVRTHTGWAGGVFLTAAHLDVQLPSELAGYRLPDQPRSNVAEAMRASLDLLDVAPWTVTFPLWAAQFLAPLCPWLPQDFTLWLHGQTGTLKSTLAALFLSHFGEFDRTTLPASWMATENALEALAFFAKDVPLVIDDYSSRDLQPKAERLLRGQGNRSGRSRLGPDLALATSYWPRGLIISTGEDVPTGRSLLARTLVVDMRTGATKLRAVTQAQERRHLLPHAMAGYVHWLAERGERLTEELPAAWAAARTKATRRGRHLRQPELMSSLHVAARLALDFAREAGVLTSSEADQVLERGWRALMRSAAAQARRIEEERPSTVFLRGLLDLLAANDGRVPGLLGQLQGVRDFEASPAGRLGWEDAEYIYLLGSVAYRMVETSLGKLPVTKGVLWKELDSRGILERCGRGRLAKHMTIAGRGYYV